MGEGIRMNLVYLAQLLGGELLGEDRAFVGVATDTRQQLTGAL